MKQKEIKTDSNKSFGIVFFVIFIIVALWPLLKDENIRVWSFIVSIILPLDPRKYILFSFLIFAVSRSFRH